MKKKVFSKLLMVALVAAVGAFTSCKDYDDDINDLRSQINGLESSLKATIDKNASDASSALETLSKQLEVVKADYAKADEALGTQLQALQEADKALQGDINANKGKIEANLQSINDLKQEVASLYATKASLEAAKEALEKSLKETNDLLKAQGETIATLVATDQTLEKGINDAKALAEKAQSAADAAQKAADKVAGDLNTQVTKEENDIANLQKQITDNLTSLTKKIDDVNAALDARITTNTTNIANLRDDVSKNYATLVYVNAQIDGVKAANAKVAADLETAKTNLQNAIKAGDDAQAAALEAAKAYLVEEIGKVADKANATATALEVLTKAHADDIDALNTKLDTELKKFQEEMVGHYIPLQVALQVPPAIQKFYNETIKPYVDEADNKNLTLIENLTKRFEEDSIKLAGYLAGQYLEAIKALVSDSADVVRGEMEVTAKNLKDAYEEADRNINKAITDMKDENVEGSLAYLLKDAKTTLGNQIADMKNPELKGSLAWYINGLEEFIGKDEEGNLSYEALAKSIAGTKTFGEAVEQAVKKANGEMLQMITSINLYANQHHAQDNEGGFEEFDHDLIFTYAIEKDNIFPAADLQKFVDDSLKFTDGFVHTQTDKVLVRVSPTNADLSDLFENDAKAIALFNSQGENIVGNVIKVVSVKRYAREGYITRSDDGPQTGLWEIEFKLVEENSDVWGAFEKAAFTGEDNEDQILYAVGVKSNEVAEGEKERYVVSEYDLALGTQESFHSYDFTVNNEDIAKIHNRYIVNENKPNDGEELWTADKANFPETYAFEKTYAFDYSTVNCDNNIDFPALTPAEFTEENVVDRFMNENNKAGGYNVNGIDNRHDFAVKLIQFNRTDETGTWADININFPLTMCNGERQTKIAGFYVTLDQEFAKESNSSEITSWTSYWYDGVGFYCVNNGQFDAQRQDEQRGVKDGICKAKLFEGTSGTISIKDYNSAKGDVIGFRVYAVNLDGTLTDPDGRAFYVKVGDEGTAHKLVFNVEAFNIAGDAAIQSSEDIVAYNKANEEKFFNIKQTELNKRSYYTIDYVWAANDAQPVVYDGNEQGVKPVAGTKGYAQRDLIDKLFTFTYSSDAEATVDGDSWKTWNEIATGTYTSEEAAYKDIQNVKVTLKRADCMVDEATYYLTAIVKLHQPDLSETVVNTIAVEITKNMPDELPAAFMVRGASKDNNPVYDEHVFIRPMKTVNTLRRAKVWDIDTWFDADDKDSNYGWDNVTDNALIWASDTRPYCLEEMFVGMINEDHSVNTNYTFEFEGCGDFAANDTEGDAVSTYLSTRSIATAYAYADMAHWGLNTEKNAELREPKHPRYTIPYVFNGATKLGKISVKAGYTYEDISYNPEEGIRHQSDWVVAPNYFNSQGRFTTKDKAAFKVEFKCALEGTFTVDATVNEVTVSDQNQHAGTSTDKIPYGNNFTVYPGSVNTPTVKWDNSLPVYVRPSRSNDNFIAKGASYHRAAFDQILNVNEKLDNSKFYATYSTAAATPNANGVVNNLVGLIHTSDVETENELSIKGGKYVLKEGSTNKTYNLTEEEIKHFYAIEKNANGSWNFRFLDNTTVVGKVVSIEITFASKATTFGLVHQWGHITTNAKEVGPKEVTVYIADPYASGNINARQAR